MSFRRPSLEEGIRHAREAEEAAQQSATLNLQLAPNITSNAQAPPIPANLPNQTLRSSMTPPPHSAAVFNQPQSARQSRSPPLRRLSYRTRDPLKNTNPQDNQVPGTVRRETEDREIIERLADHQKYRIAECEAALQDVAAVEGQVRRLSIQPAICDATSVEEPAEFSSLEDLHEHELWSNKLSRYVRVPIYNPLTDRWTMCETYILNGFGHDPDNDPALQEMLAALGWSMSSAERPTESVEESYA